MLYTPASGQPVNVVLSPDGREAYIVNHSGAAAPPAADHFQHGHVGTVTVLNVAKALDRATNMTLGTVEAIIPTGNFGPVGLRRPRELGKGTLDETLRAPRNPASLALRTTAMPL